MADQDQDNLRELVAEVAAAYFSNSHVNPGEIPNVVQQIASSLSSIGAQQQQPAEEPQQPKLTPAQIRKSITPDALISFEDGRPYKTLKRHLSGRGLSPADYRSKYGLPADYPMVAPNYSAARSEMARNLGLGQKGRAARGAKAAGGSSSSGGSGGGGRGRRSSKS
jgi:predicted transcriptional regulator